MSGEGLEERNLVNVLAALRAQLVEARRQGENADLRFSLEDIEVELTFQVSTDANAKGGVKFWVVTADVGGKVASESVQKVKLKMKLADANTPDASKISGPIDISPPTPEQASPP
ncbi:MAG TPA: trypco2 family protein [Roseiarcus sp.]|nr:trypco2 family protein [Roseiarcus sp.]